jgi:outer membrane protein
MIRFWTPILLVTLALVSQAGAESADWHRLGTVRGDTLYVERDALIAAALERNEMLAASSAMADAASAEAAGAWAGFLPHVSVGEYFLRSDDALNAFGYKLVNRAAQPSDFAPDVLNNPGEVNNWVTQFKLLQPVFNGGMSLNGKQAADAASLAASYQHRRAEETVRLQAVQIHEGLRLTHAMIGVVEAAVRSAEAHEQRARSLVEAEMATEADLLQARVYVASLRQQLITTRNYAAAAGDAVQLLTAIDVPLPLTAAVAPTDTTVPAAPDTAVVALVRSDLLAAEQQAKAAGKMVGVATGAMLPHVNLSLERNYFSHDDIFGDDATSWSLGAYATWNVFDGLQSISARRQARAQQRAAEHGRDFQARQARQEAQQAWRDVQAAADRLVVARDAMGAANESLRIVSNQYGEGLASMTDLLDVQTAEIAAAGGLAQAEHDYNVSLARLEYAAGSPQPEGDDQ